jgi:hypothetical protein
MPKLSSVPRKISVIFVLSFFILAAFAVSGFTITTLDGQTGLSLPPNEGPVSPQAGGEDGRGQAAAPVDVIRNGGFEQDWDPIEHEGVAPEWNPYSNGQAHFGWYQEEWPEAVRTGQFAQLMEIFMVEPNVQSRVIAIHQTVDVAPNSVYDLELYAIMRSQAPASARNNNEFEMHWGVDYSGEADYDNVQEWNLMSLEEQFRLGSAGEFPDDVPLFYELVTGTIETGDSDRLTLYIRGLKKFSTGTEVNYDVDDVSLVGPPPDAVVEPEEPEPVEDDEEVTMPESGAILPENVSGGTLIFGSLVLVILGAAATAAVVQKRRKMS